MESGKRNVYYNSLLSLSQILYPLITFPYASRVLGPNGIGLFSFVDSITQYFVLIAAFGIPIYGIREIAKNNGNKESQSKLYSELIFIHFSFTLLLVILYIGLAYAVPRMNEHRTMFWIGSGILFFNVFPTEWFFQGIQNFAFVAKRTIIIRICSIVALFLFVKDKNDVENYYLINLVAFILNSIINVWFAKKFIKISIKDLKLKHHVKPLLYLFSSNVAISIYLLMDSIMLGFLVNDEAVGYYTTAVRLSKVFVLLITAFSLVMIPKLSSLFENKNKTEVNRLLKISFEYIFFLAIPIGVGLFVVADDFIKLYAGNKFLPAIITVKIMSPLVLLIGLSNLFGMQILTPAGKEKQLLIGVALGMVCSICLNVLLIPILKENGAAITNIVTELVVTLTTGYYALKTIKVNIPWRRFIEALLTSSIFIPIHYFILNFELNYLYRLICEVIMCSSIYGLVQFYVWKNGIIILVVDTLKKRLDYAKV